MSDKEFLDLSQEEIEELCRRSTEDQAQAAKTENLAAHEKIIQEAKTMLSCPCGGD